MTGLHRLTILPLLSLLIWSPTAVYGWDILSELIGQWNGRGQLFGQEAVFDMQWAAALDQSYVRLRFHNALVRPEGPHTMVKAEAFYRMPVDDSTSGVWIDSRGIILPLRSQLTDSTLVTFWGDSTIERGKTVYRLLATGAVAVVDSVYKNGVLDEFGSATYERVTSGD